MEIIKRKQTIEEHIKHSLKDEDNMLKQSYG